MEEPGGRSPASMCDARKAMADMRELKADLWEHLPNEILERVLAFLPVHTLFQSRIVCKKWNAWISSAAFNDLCTQVGVQKAHILLADNDEVTDRRTLSSSKTLYAFDTTINKWQRIDTSFLLPFSNAMRGNICFWTRLAAADSGLLLVLWIPSVHHDAKVIAVVCNPLSKTSEQLPDVVGKVLHSSSVVMVVDDKTKAYKVYVVTLHQLWVYESQIRSWVLLGPTPADMCRDPMVVWDRTLYALVKLPKQRPLAEIRNSFIFELDTGYELESGYESDEYVLCNRHHVLIAYDMHANAWYETNVLTPEIADSSRLKKLMVRDGSLWLVANVCEPEVADEDEEDGSAYCSTYRIWQLKESWKFVQVTRMPDSLFQRLHVTENLNSAIDAFSYGDYILLVSSNGKPVVYNVAQGLWGCLPDCEPPSSLPEFCRSGVYENFVNFVWSSPTYVRTS